MGCVSKGGEITEMRSTMYVKFVLLHNDDFVVCIRDSRDKRKRNKQYIVVLLVINFYTISTSRSIKSGRY